MPSDEELDGQSIKSANSSLDDWESESSKSPDNHNSDKDEINHSGNHTPPHSQGTDEEILALDDSNKNDFLHRLACKSYLSEELSEALEKNPLLINTPHSKTGLTPIYYAAKFGCADIVKYLLTKNPILNARDKTQNNILWLAIKFNDLEVALCIAKPQIFQQFEDDTTELHVAMLKGQLDLVDKILKEDGNRINEKNAHGKNVVDWVLLTNNEIVQNFLRLHAAFALLADIDKEKLLDPLKRSNGMDAFYSGEHSRVAKEFLFADKIQHHINAILIFESITNKNTFDHSNIVSAYLELSQCYSKFLEDFDKASETIDKAVSSCSLIPHGSSEIAKQNKKIQDAKELLLLQKHEKFALSDRSLVTVETLADGDCLFHAFAKHLENTKKEALADLPDSYPSSKLAAKVTPGMEKTLSGRLRILALLRLIKFEESYTPFLENDISFETYLENKCQRKLLKSIFSEESGSNEIQSYLEYKKRREAHSQKIKEEFESYWGDQQMMFALARELKFNLYIIRKNAVNTEILHLPEAADTIYLYYDGEHYQLLTKTPGIEAKINTEIQIAEHPLDAFIEKEKTAEEKQIAAITTSSADETVSSTADTQINYSHKENTSEDLLTPVSFSTQLSEDKKRPIEDIISTDEDKTERDTKKAKVVSDSQLGFFRREIVGIQSTSQTQEGIDSSFSGQWGPRNNHI